MLAEATRDRYDSGFCGPASWLYGPAAGAGAPENATESRPTAGDSVRVRSPASGRVYLPITRKKSIAALSRSEASSSGFELTTSR